MSEDMKALLKNFYLNDMLSLRVETEFVMNNFEMFMAALKDHYIFLVKEEGERSYYRLTPQGTKRIHEIM
jgi:predicted transcriptional regulator